MGAAPAPDFRWLPFRVDAEGRAPTEINNVKDLLLELAMGVEHLVIEVERLNADVAMAVDVVAGAEVHLCAPVAAKRSAAKLHANVCVARRQRLTLRLPLLAMREWARADGW